WEADYFDYFRWPYYWSGMGLWGVAACPVHLAAVPPPGEDAGDAAAPAEEPAQDKADDEDSHLESLKDVTGYHIEAIDGEIGHVDDFVLDDHTWAIRYLVIDTRNWWPGKKILLAPPWVHQVSWAESKVYVDLPRATIQGSPEYDPSAPISRAYEGQLHDYYGQAHYWLEENQPSKRA
ncbi:MAG: PRC-barrel domain-containing protein, partial [Armatimonadota bacterium]|nr:PRC-barrel domain-containing protein [Armatimonadota bacterium]